jgi:hypothetical protein
LLRVTRDQPDLVEVGEAAEEMARSQTCGQGVSRIRQLLDKFEMQRQVVELICLGGLEI